MSITNLAAALLRAQKNMGVALKDAKNPFFKSKYADLNAVIDASVSVLNAEGIVVLQPTVINDQGIRVVRTTLLHESGESLCSETEIICAKDKDPQAYGSAISYARRYGLQSFVTLKSVDDDAETAMSRPAKQETTEAKSVKSDFKRASSSSVQETKKVDGWQ